jgi:peptidyl-prolyl cis-trans isomerase-like 1
MAPTHITLRTSMGELTLELYTEHAPRTCKNFETLVQRGYYDGCPFHRVIPKFMVQGGDPTGTGCGGTSIYGGEFADEIHPGLKHAGAGVLSMANAGPNTNGSQLYPPPLSPLSLCVSYVCVCEGG